MDVAKLNNVAIVSVNQAARLGRIQDVLLEESPLRVAALRASGSEGEFLVNVDRVRSFGPDAVMVDTPDVMQRPRESGATLHALADLKQRKVVDEDGTYLGMIRAIDFDPANGHIESISISSGGVLGVGGASSTIDAEAVRSIGPDLMTVASSHDAAAGERESEPRAAEPRAAEHDEATLA